MVLGYKFRVYRYFTNLEMSNTIENTLPIREHGANWGIRHVRATLACLQIRAPMCMVARALQTISGIEFNYVFYLFDLMAITVLL